jgi:tRNA-Thr(GGU) m(6)t(6)A37 methyltransferase TsaA
MKFSIEPIGYVKTCFPEKFGIPRQASLAPSAKGELILSPPYNREDCIDGLDKVSHIWVTFIFHGHIDQAWKPKVRPPRLGGNQKLGVFASRSSFRPNYLGLSLCGLESIENKNRQLVLHLSGVDMVDGTPVVDIKPYVPYADTIVTAKNKIADSPPKHMTVEFSQTAIIFFKENASNSNLKQLITEVLQQDPRPAYKDNDDNKIYKMSLYHFDIAWKIKHKDSQYVIEVVNIQD